MKLYSETSKLRTVPELRFAHSVCICKYMRTFFRGLADCLLAQFQISPDVSAFTPDGIVHDYIEGITLSESDMLANPDLGQKIATVYVDYKYKNISGACLTFHRLRRLHTLPIPKQYGFHVYESI